MKIYKQRSDFDYLLACLSTILQKDYDKLWPDDFKRRVEKAKGCYGDILDEAFRIVQLNRDTDYWTCFIPGPLASDAFLKKLLNGRRAILQVPSLNYPRSQHLVVWMGEALYDPSNKLAYQWIDQLAIQYVWVFNEVNSFSSARILQP